MSGAPVAQLVVAFVLVFAAGFCAGMRATRAYYWFWRLRFEIRILGAMVAAGLTGRVFAVYGQVGQGCWNAFNGTSLAGIGADVPFYRYRDGTAMMTEDDAAAVLAMAQQVAPGVYRVGRFDPRAGGLQVERPGL